MRALGASRTSLVPGGVLAGPWVRNDLWRRARAVPSLDLRFADNKSLTDAVTGASLVTFTRASSGTYTDSAGVLQTAATDVPRFDHDPTTGESLGLLVEEQRTNSIRNNTMVGAVAGTPGTNPTGWIYATAQSNGLTLSILGTGVENGINYIDYRFNGTTVASPGACAIGLDSGVAATGQTWTEALYWKLVGGSATGVANWQLGLIETTSGGAFVAGAFYTKTAPTSAALINQRPTATRTLSGGATVGLCSAVLNVPVTGSTAIDFTLRIGLPQLEQGAFATSPILTSGTAVTRNADVASITGSAFSGWYRQDEGTMFAEGAVTQPAPGVNQFVFRSSDNSFNNQIALNIQSLGFVSIATAAGGVFDGVAASALTLSANTAAKFAGAYAVNNLNVSLNGATAVTDTSATIPTALTRADIGSDHIGANRVKAGTIKRICYWNQRLPNPTLQTLTQ